MATDDKSMLTNWLPWWAKLLSISGPVAAIAVYLVWWITTSLSAQIVQQQNILQDHLKQTQSIAESLQLDLQRQSDDARTVQTTADATTAAFKALLRLEYQTCVNTAKSTYQTDKCLNGANGL